jgi:hypothetical protein
MARDRFPGDDMMTEVAVIESVQVTEAHDHAAEEMVEAAMCLVV